MSSAVQQAKTKVGALKRTPGKGELRAFIYGDGLVLLLFLVGLMLLTVPRGLIERLPAAPMAWTAFVVLTVAGWVGWKIARRHGESPWVYPTGALMIFYALRYGLGSLVVNYMGAIPWTVNADYMRLTYAEAAQNMSYGVYLCVLGGAGLMLGTLISAGPTGLVLPALPWRVDRGGVSSRCLLLLIPVTACWIAAREARELIPPGLHMVASIVGAFGFVLSMVGVVMYLERRGSAPRKWLVLPAIFIPVAIFTGLSVGMREGVLWPLAVLAIGYLLVRGSVKWFWFVGAAAVIFLVLPWVTLYKLRARVTLREESVTERVVASTEDYLDLSFSERVQMGSQTLFGRLFGGPKFVCVFSRYWPSRYDYLGGKTLLMEMRFLLPRLFFPGRQSPGPQIDAYSRLVGILGRHDSVTSAKMDAVTEYYVNWGARGVFLLFIAHGYFWKVMYDWLVRRGEWLIGAPMVACMLWDWHDLMGIGFVFTAHVKGLIVWIPLVFLLAGGGGSAPRAGTLGNRFGRRQI